MSCHLRANHERGDALDAVVCFFDTGRLLDVVAFFVTVVMITSSLRYRADGQFGPRVAGAC